MDKTLKKNLSLVLYINILISILSVLSNLYFIRQLGVVKMGLFAIIITLVDITLSFFNFGFNQYIIMNPKDDKIYNSIFTLVFFQSIIFLALPTISFLVYVKLFNNDLITLLVPLILISLSRAINLYTTFFYSRAEASLQYKPIMIFRLICRFIGVLTGFYAVYFYDTIYGLVFRDLIYTLLYTISIIVIYKPKVSFYYNKKLFKEIWSFIKNLYGLNLLERLILRLDYLIVENIFGINNLGIYYSIRSIFEGIYGLVILPVQTVMLSFYARYNNKKELIFKLHKYCYYLFALFPLVFLIEQFNFTFLIEFFIGEEYVNGSSLISGLVMYYISMIWFENIKSLAISLNVHFVAVYSRIVQLFILPILLYVLCNFFDFFGAGLATGISSLLLAFLTTLYLKNNNQKICVE